MNKVLVLDTSALSLASTAEGDAYTTSKNIEEAKRGPLARLLQSLIDAGKLVVRDPKPPSLKAVREAALATGDAAKLSEADLFLVALVLDLASEGFDATLVTDDYSVQNVALRLGLKIAPATTRGVRELVEWINYCPVCGTTYRGRVSTCPECGVALKRKRRRDRLRGKQGK